MTIIAMITRQVAEARTVATLLNEAAGEARQQNLTAIAVRLDQAADTITRLASLVERVRL